MVNLKDISGQFIKPTKSLSNWNFPLSKILIEYYSLLEGHKDVNFGEAALILQNSINIYSHRVEILFNEAAALNNMFINYDLENNANTNKSSKNNKRDSNKNLINFDDFKLCNLSNEIGKNINIKNKFNIERPVKLLTRRFIQLENIIEDPFCNGLKIIDIHGDVIGNKYDFRCNQYLNTNGLLIDEPTLDDFKIIDNLDVSATSGYCSNTSTLNNTYNSVELIDTNDIITDNNTETLTNCCLSPLEEHADCSVDMNDFNETDDAINEIEQTIDISENKESQDNSKTNKLLFINCDININKTNNLCNISDDNQTSSKKLKEIKCSTNMKKTFNSKIWEPIPLTHNISLKRKRIDLLDSTSSIILRTECKKRKFISQMYEGDCVVNFLLKESKMLQDKYSTQRSKKQLLPQFKSEEIDEIQKVFDDCFKNKKTFNSSSENQTINATTNDLKTRTNSIDDDLSSDDTFFDDSGILTCSSDILDSEISPRLDNVFSPIISQPSMSNYEKLIEDKMKELFEESNVKTELDCKITKWHQSIQLKLAEIEKKPIFCIQNYASRIIHKLNDKTQNNKNQNVSFNDIVNGEHSYDVARYFLALLQLANTYHVDLKQNKTIDERIEITLLDKSNKDA